VINAEEADILVFSFIGYKSVEVPVGSRTIIDIALSADAHVFDEIVVVGYGTMKKSDLTGAVANVDMEKMAELPNVSVLQSLQGSIAGLNIGQVDAAGEDPTISIRGQSTLSSSAADNAPLIVVDGIIYRGSIIDLNTADIASVDILKDASSAAIYGSQASNGVVLITTKKGKATGKPIISYTGSYTFQEPAKNLVPMRAAEYEKFYNDLWWDRGRLAPDYLQPDPNFSIIPQFKTLEIADGYRAGVDSDWWGGLTSNGHINNHNVSIRGQNERTNYFVSGGYTDVEGFMKNDTYKKYNYRINFDAQINDWFKIGAESFLASSDYSGYSLPVGVAFAYQPWAPIYDENGEYTQNPSGDINPYTRLKTDDSDRRLNLFGNIHTDIKLPFLEGFNYRINYAQNYRTINQDRFDPLAVNFTGSGYKNTSLYYDWTFDNIFSYQRSINDLHNINLTLVYGVEERNSSFTNASAQNFVIDDLGYNRLEAGDPALNGVNSGKGRENSLYSMARASYSYNNKYLLTATVRRDGFSGFGANNKFGVFPSVAAGWAVSEEPFFQDLTSTIGYLKARASYGTTGRRGSERYATQAVVTATPSVVFGDGGSATIGQVISSLENNDLAWETTTGLNVGVDFELFNSRILGSVEYYKNNTKDILYNINLPTMTGFTSIKTNIGKVSNHGLELTLVGKVVDNTNLKWEATGVYSRVRNEIVSILGPANDNDGDGREDDLVSNRLFIGEPQSVIYNYEIAGMWQLADDEADIIPDGFFPGTHKITDLNGDGVYSAAGDMKILGYVDPAYRFGIANTLRYKNFSLYVFVNSIQGGKNYYMGDDSPQAEVLWYKRDQLSYSNVPSGAWDYWMPEHPNAKYRRLDQDSQYAPRVYGQRSFVRLQDVSLAYNFQPALLEKIKISNLKIFLSGKNLATWTNWQGWDPEVGTGFDADALPVMRNYSLGLNLEF
jgi:TonB-linked SusC/RagA family outer membrane protein